MSSSTMTQERWDSLSADQRDKERDLSALRPELMGLEGWRIEATDKHGERKRFIVGKSTGWKPCHLEILRRNSMGGMADFGPYTNIRRIERVR